MVADDQLTEIRPSPLVIVYESLQLSAGFRNHQQDLPPTCEGGVITGVTNNLRKIPGTAFCHVFLSKGWPLKGWDQK